jgi:hypothetical protein
MDKDLAKKCVELYAKVAEAFEKDPEGTKAAIDEMPGWMLTALAAGSKIAQK